MVPRHHLAHLGGVFTDLKEFLTSPAPEGQLDLPDVRLYVAFLSFACGQRPRPLPRLDQVQSLFRVIFSILQLHDDNPANAPLSRAAKQSIVTQATQIAAPPPGQLDIKQFVSFLRSFHPTDWLGLRNKTLALYVLVLGRRPSNASRALWPAPSAICQWGAQITELGSKRDRSRRGSHVFIQLCSDAEVCFVRHLHQYLVHPTTIEIRARVTSATVPLFLQKFPGLLKNHSLAKATSSVTIRNLMAAAACRTDATGAKVDPRDIRPAVYSLCVREGSVPLPMIRHMQDWTQQSVADRHYLRGESPLNWPDFVLGITSALSDGFCSLLRPPPPSSPGDTSSALVRLHPSGPLSTVLSHNIS